MFNNCTLNKNNMKLNNEQFDILRDFKILKISKRAWKQFNLSLGKVNYCLKALKDKGIIKFKILKKQK